MKLKHWIILTALNAACLLAAYGLMALGKENSKILAESQAEQNLSARTAAMENFQQALVRDIAKASATSPALRTMLLRRGYNMDANPGLDLASPANNPAPNK